MPTFLVQKKKMLTLIFICKNFHHFVLWLVYHICYLCFIFFVAHNIHLYSCGSQMHPLISTSTNYCPTFEYGNETGGLGVWVVTKQAYISVHVLSEKAKWIVIQMILAPLPPKKKKVIQIINQILLLPLESGLIALVEEAPHHSFDI